MRNKKLKITSAILFLFASGYLFKNWEVYNDKSKVDMEKIDLTQPKLEISTIRSKFDNPIWHAKKEGPIVSCRIIFKNEGDRSFKHLPKIVDIIIASLLEGAGSRNSIEIRKFIEDRSINLSVISELDSIIVNISTLEKYFPIAMDLVGNICSNAHLPNNKFENKKQEMLVSLNQSKFSTKHLAVQALSKILYPKDHPYRQDIDSAIKNIPSYSTELAKKCYSSMFCPKNAIINIASNMKNADITAIFDKFHMAISSKTNDSKTPEQSASIPAQKDILHIEIDNPQSSVVFALPGVLRTSNQRFAMRFAKMIFSTNGFNSFNSRLMKNIRDDKGLVYGISANISDNDLHSYIFGIANTRPENVKKVIAEIKHECAKLVEDGITSEELENFKTALCAGTILDSASSVVDFISDCRKDGILIENINKFMNNYFNLTKDDVEKVIPEIFNPNNIIFVTAGKGQKETAK